VKQKKLLKKVMKASLENDTKAIDKLRMEEYEKIFERKAQNKPFTTRWTLVSI
jgi:hypothetical protein